MGKKRDAANEDPAQVSGSPGSAHKKHKKHKKKHKKDKKRDHSEDTQTDSSPTKPIKLKIRFGGTKTVMTVSEPQQDTPAISMVTKREAPSASATMSMVDLDPESLDPGVVWKGNDDTFMTKKPGEDTSDEEREWLDALEAGTLDDQGGVKKNSERKLLTTRQRALFHGEQQEELQQLPSGYKIMELTEEQVQKRKQKAHKRRQQAHEKREKDKKQTLDRLLKKQDKPKSGKGRARKQQVPSFRYVQNRSGCSISVPQGFSFPYPKKAAMKVTPSKVMCGVKGCKNAKKYACSKTGIPLCSLQCYQLNQKLHGNVT